MSLLNPKIRCRDCGKFIDQLTASYNHGRCDECAEAKNHWQDAKREMYGLDKCR